MYLPAYPAMLWVTFGSRCCISRHDFQFTGEITLEFQLNAAHAYRIGLHAEEGIDWISGQYVLLTYVERPPP